jgi:hypothetical protein
MSVSTIPVRDPIADIDSNLKYALLHAKEGDTAYRTYLGRAFDLLKKYRRSIPFSEVGRVIDRKQKIDNIYRDVTSSLPAGTDLLDVTELVCEAGPVTA